MTQHCFATWLTARDHPIAIPRLRSGCCGARKFCLPRSRMPRGPLAKNFYKNSYFVFYKSLRVAAYNARGYEKLPQAIWGNLGFPFYLLLGDVGRHSLIRSDDASDTGAISV